MSLISSFPDGGGISTTEKGIAGGVAELDNNGAVPTTQLPDIPLSKGGTGAATAAQALANLISGSGALTSSTLDTADLVAMLDNSGSTGGKLSIADLITYLSSNLGGAKIETGSYVGTGTYGSSNPCTLTFAFKPLLVMIGRANYNSNEAGNQTATLMYGQPRGYCLTKSYNGLTQILLTWAPNNLQWYHDATSDYQYNYSRETYRWVAIG